MVRASRKLGTNVKQDNRLLNINNKSGAIELAQRGLKGTHILLGRPSLISFITFRNNIT